MASLFKLIKRFIYRNPVYPAKKSELRIIVSNMLKHLEKNSLSYISRIIHIPQYSVCCIENRPFILVDQFGHGHAVTPFTVVNKGSIPVLMHNYMPGPIKLVKAYNFLSQYAALTGGRYDFKKLVKTGITKYIADVVIDVNKLDPITRTHQTLVCFE